MSTNWKEHILKSSLPLEFEVKKFLDAKGCVSAFDYTYIKDDENHLPKEFSYDIDSTYIRGPHFVDLMIECKYRHKSTNWVFLPEDYGGPPEVYPNSFMHANDHFCKYKFPYTDEFPIQLAPLCSKGIELTSTGSDPKSIHQAVTQLSYAFAEQVADGMAHQIERLLRGGVIFYHVPIIVTTANLFRLHPNVDIRSIEQANSLPDIADEHNYLVLKNHIGIQLRNHSERVLNAVLSRYDAKLIKKKLSSFNKDVRFVLSVIATHTCPETFVLIRHTADNAALSKFFEYISGLLNPSEELKSLIKKQRDGREERFRAIMKKSRRARHITGVTTPLP